MLIAGCRSGAVSADVRGADVRALVRADRSPGARPRPERSPSPVSPTASVSPVTGVRTGSGSTSAAPPTVSVSCPTGPDGAGPADPEPAGGPAGCGPAPLRCDGGAGSLTCGGARAGGTRLARRRRSGRRGGERDRQPRGRRGRAGVRGRGPRRVRRGERRGGSGRQGFRRVTVEASGAGVGSPVRGVGPGRRTVGQHGHPEHRPRGEQGAGRDHPAADGDAGGRAVAPVRSRSCAGPGVSSDSAVRWAGMRGAGTDGEPWARTRSATVTMPVRAG